MSPDRQQQQHQTSGTNQLQASGPDSGRRERAMLINLFTFETIISGSVADGRSRVPLSFLTPNDE